MPPAHQVLSNLPQNQRMNMLVSAQVLKEAIPNLNLAFLDPLSLSQLNKSEMFPETLAADGAELLQ